jgi:hypothetical protein
MKYSSYARENQDLFILSVLDGKRSGTYVEIGAYLPIEDNNTYLLESSFDWKGISLELYEEFSSKWPSHRKNPCITCDATKVNYTELFEEHSLPNHIDFLQVDIDPTSATYEALKLIDFEKYSFSVITFEHDLYRSGDTSYWGGEDCNFYREKSREYLGDLGYTCLVPDVTHGDKVFEDWFINEKLMPSDSWKKFIGIDPVMNTPDMKESTKNIFEQLL